MSVEMEQTMWQLKYRENGILKEGMVQAGSFRRAVEVARKWCSQVPDRQYIALNEAFLADESILGEAEVVKVEAPSNWHTLSARMAIASVERGEIGPGEAMRIEAMNQNRKGVMEYLQARISTGEEKGVPF